MRRTHIFFLFFIIGIFMAFFPQNSNAEISLEMLQEDIPAFDLQEAKDFTDEIVPLVENAAGRKFTKILEIVIADRTMITKILTAELKPQLENLYPSYSVEEIEQLSLLQARILSISLLGKYGIRDGKLYLLPRNLPPLLKLIKSDDEDAKSILKLILAHELTHALQDQEVNLKRVNQITQIDQFNAFSAVFEGHAVWVQDTVGRQMGLHDSIVTMSRMMSAGAIEFEDPAMQMINKMVASKYEQIYLGGERFIGYFYQQGGNDKVWQILIDPPQKTLMILKPETYDNKPAGEPDYAILFQNLANEFDSQVWQVQNRALGQMEARAVYSQIEPTDREKILNQIVHIQTYAAQNIEAQSIVNISAIVIQDSQFISTYIKLLENLVQKNVKLMKSSPTIKIKDFEISGFSALQADSAHKITFILTGKNISAKQTFVRICKGNLMLEVYLNNYPMNDTKIAQIADDIFKRFQKLSKADH